MKVYLKAISIFIMVCFMSFTTVNANAGIWNKVKKATKKAVKKVKKTSKKVAKKVKKTTKKVVKKTKKAIHKGADKLKGPTFKRHKNVKKSINPKKRKRKQSEKAWYYKLKKISKSQLKPGDIILVKKYGTPNQVVLAQAGLKARAGSRYTCHAMMYYGNGNIVESSSHKNGVWINNLSKDYKKRTLLVYRINDKKAVKGALKVAKKWARVYKKGAKANIKYSREHCFTVIGTSSYGKNAEKRAKKVRKLKAPSNKMMCSEFVTYCYQNLKNPTIRLDALHTSPQRLEDYLNQTGHFEFKGRITP